MRRKDWRKMRVYVRRSKDRAALREIVRFIAGIVVFCTTYALILPAITLETTDALCGLSHEHEAACYAGAKVTPPDENARDLTGLTLHTHNQFCFDTGGNMICPLPEVFEHVHTEECYEIVIPETAPAVEPHVHDEACYIKERGALLCTIAEPERHIHTDSCYEIIPPETVIHEHTETCYIRQQGEMICELPEQEGHTHDAACYGIGTEPICGTEEGEEHTHTDACYGSVLICALPEEAGHVHGDDCYAWSEELVCEATQQPEITEPEKILICTEDDQIHVHTESCYVLGSAPICGKAEDETHTHTNDCYERILTCELPGITGHLHRDECYAWHDVLVCQQPEVTEPGETLEPTEPVKILTCTKGELSNHVHIAACYGVGQDGSTQLICTKYQMDAHYHTEKCLGFSEDALICTLEENEEHSHGYGCYSTWTFLCQTGGKPESDPTADVESRKDWEETFAHVQLTGVWADDLLAIAQTQLGYRESERNFVLADDDEKKGYTRYGDWYGNQYGDWCAMFASFCLHYANVKDFPQQQSCNWWIVELKEAELYYEAASYVPRKGDIIFFERSRTAETPPDAPVDSDHVGIVMEILPATEEEPAQVRTIEGNSGNTVEIKQYDLTDPRIVGYGQLPENPEVTYYCGLEEHTHSAACYDAVLNLICQIPEHSHDESCRIRKLVYTDETMRVDLALSGTLTLPEDLSLQVSLVQEEDQSSYGPMITAVGNAMFESTYFMGDILFCRMELLSEGQVYELPEGVLADVHVSFLQPVFRPDAVAEAADLKTFVLSEESDGTEETEEPVVYEAFVSDAPMLFAVTDNGDDPQNPDMIAETVDTNGYVDDSDLPSYQAVAVDANSYENAEDGITGVQFTTSRIATFAVTLADTSQEGGFWKRVTSTSDFTSDGVYMIVSPEGMYAFAANSNTNMVRVNVDMVKGNPGYYTITDDNGNDVTNTYLNWQFTGSGTSYTIYNGASRNYLNMSASSLLSTTSASIALSYQQAEGTWVLHHTYKSSGWRPTTYNYYLSRTGTAKFDRSTSSGTYAQQMLIYKLVETTLTVPDDVVSGSTGGSGAADIPDKPEYDPYIGVTGGLTGNTAHETVQGKYYSDPATSQIESLISGEENDDGRVLTDKSVIFGDDDYGAFDHYDPNTFGVTLSALGQEYLVEDKHVVVTPIDVVFVLDVSGSMQTEVGGKSRAQAMVDAVNTSMKEILDQNPYNRVGVVIYSSGAWDLLELGRYSQSNNQYLRTQTISGNSWKSGRYNVLAGTNLKVTDDSGKIYDVSGADQANGTYTQAGIARGANMLRRSNPKTYTEILYEGTESEQSVTVRRQPVIILLSDGEPTHCTSNYKDVLSGPHYGDGLVDGNYQGVYGYYTILSANYYKRMVGISYNYPALFYTVGMGISENQDVALSGNNNDSDVYKRAVLNPTVYNITNLSSKLNPTNTVNQLKALMLNTFTNKQISVSVTNQSYMTSWMGQVHSSVPVLKNPYSGNYSYAEKAYFGQIGESELDSIFGEILETSMRVNSYGFILQSRSAVEMIDPIGAGMEVKGDPILRYGGKNYTHTAMHVNGNKTTYVYDYVYNSTDGSRHSADLKNLIVEVITDENGLQTVHLDVPDLTLPAYSPYLYNDAQGNIPFYYEALPVRLIYQVGLTEEAQADVADLGHYGGKLTYYTNRYEDIIANSLMKPTNANPYYAVGSENDHNHGVDKRNNLTGTDEHSFECHHDRKTFGGEVVPWITQELGNNGKLEFEAPRTVIDIPVEKHWEEEVPPDKWTSITLQLYSVIDDVTQLVDTRVLSSENEWKAVFDRLPVLETGFYAVREVVPDGFIVSYGGETATAIINGKPTTVAVIPGQEPVEAPMVIVTNSNAYYLPETGGSGTQYYTLSGWLMISAAALMYICIFGRKRKRGGGCSS